MYTFPDNCRCFINWDLGSKRPKLENNQNSSAFHGQEIVSHNRKNSDFSIFFSNNSSTWSYASSHKLCKLRNNFALYALQKAIERNYWSLFIRCFHHIHKENRSKIWPYMAELEIFGFTICKNRFETGLY